MPSSSTERSLSVITGGSPEGVSDDLVGSVQRYIDAVVAPLREQILVQQVEIEALKARPSPQIDGLIDRTGMLMLTRGDGTVREAGIVVGRDGKDGATNGDFEAMLALIKAELAKRAARPEPQPGRDGQPGLPGRDGAPGKDGADGVGFDDLQVTYDGERKFTFRFVRGEKVKEFDFTVPMAIYRGVFKEGTAYVTGDQVSFGGSIWHCLEPTTDKPGQGNPAWKLACKHGRDGRDGKSAYRGRRRRRLQGQRKRLAEDVERSTWAARQRPAASLLMTDDVDELLRQADVKFDQAIIELAVEEGNRLLAAGAHARRPASADGSIRGGGATVARQRHGRGARARQAYQADRGAHAGDRGAHRADRGVHGPARAPRRDGALICPGSRPP